MHPHLKTRSTLALVLASAALLAHAAPAFADESPAERMFREGRARMLDGRFDEACPMLEESHRLEPHVGTLLNVAACHERQGRVGSAWVEYQKALTAARAEGQAERAQLAGERIKVLEPRVPWLRISSISEDVTIAVDGGRIEHVAWGQEMPVDPGAHAVTATNRGGAKVYEERLELREGEHRSVRIDVGALAGPAPVQPEQERVVVEPKPADKPETHDAGEASHPKHASPWVIEPGLFLGPVGGSADFPRAKGTLGNVGLRSSTSAQTSTCSDTSCKVGALRDGSGVVAGINLFAGYALSETIHLGARLVVAPSLGSNGAAVYALGPSIVLHPTEAFAIGAWPFFGNATLQGRADVSAPSGYQLTSAAEVPVEGDLHGAFGLGIELSLRLFSIGRGDVIANATPLFMAGSSGTAACLPIGIAYRFQ